MAGMIKRLGRSPVAPNLEPSAAHMHRIRQRAHHLWEQDERPAGQMNEYLERAHELDAIETTPPALLPNPLTARSGPGCSACRAGHARRRGQWTKRIDRQVCVNVAYSVGNPRWSAAGEHQIRGK
jgi:hypothetical protein